MKTEPRMDTKPHELICKDEVFAVVGRALEVPRELGHGLPEKLHNYLRITGLKIGLILNFKNTKLEWKRVVL
jgi:PD-(D/E)XK nuclease superfamily